MMPLQSGSNINTRVLSFVLLWQGLNQMEQIREREWHRERKGETEEAKGEAIFMFNRWIQRTKENYGGQDREAEKYQKGNEGMTKNSSFKKDEIWK